MKADEKCQYGIEFEKCPHAIGIVINGVRFDGTKWEDDPVWWSERMWRPVCCDFEDACPITRSRKGNG